MKQLSKLLGSSFVSAVVLATGAGAQENAPTPTPTPVIEIFPCTYIGNNDIDNLRTVNTRFNAWADRNSVTTYTAFTLTPYAYSADLETDVLWLGAWPNGTAMGENEALWQSQGGDVAAAFGAVVDCNSHSLYAEVVINQPSTPPPERGVAMFEDCTVHEGRTVPEAIAAATQWAEYTKTRGPDAFRIAEGPSRTRQGDVAPGRWACEPCSSNRRGTSATRCPAPEVVTWKRRSCEPSGWSCATGAVACEAC